MKRFVLLMCLAMGSLLVASLVFSEDMPDAANPDHWEGLAGPFTDGISVTQTCLECHEDQGQEMLSSAHWLWKGPSPHLVGHEADTQLGKTNLINNY